jgi:hypothetical protein
MNTYRAGRVCAVVVAGLLAMAGCGGAEPTPTGTGPATPSTAAAPPTSAAPVSYGQSDVDAVMLSLDDLNLSDFHKFTFPDPEGGVPARSEDCLVRWQRQHKDQRESGSYSAGQSFAQTDDVGPFIIQSASLQPGTGAKDLIAKQRDSYAAACQTWKSASGKVTYVSAADTSLGTYGDETYGYKVTATSDGGPTVILLGVMIRKGNLLTTVEFAGSPTVNLTRAKAIFAAAAKQLPQP